MLQNYNTFRGDLVVANHAGMRILGAQQRKMEVQMLIESYATPKAYATRAGRVELNHGLARHGRRRCDVGLVVVLGPLLPGRIGGSRRLSRPLQAWLLSNSEGCGRNATLYLFLVWTKGEQTFTFCSENPTPIPRPPTPRVRIKNDSHNPKNVHFTRK